MSRKEFSKAVKVACIKRATVNGIVYCDECHALAKRYEIDHKDADALTGEPTLENARLLCIPCHREKTAKDINAISEAKRREAKHLGAKPPQHRPIQNRPPAPPKEKTYKQLAKQLPPRNFRRYQDRTT